MDKKALTETDIRTKFITPAILVKWDVMTQVLEERYFTNGRVIVRATPRPTNAASWLRWIS